MSVLSGKDIKRLISGQPPLLGGYGNIEEQLQPNGFDITLKEIGIPQDAGTIAVDNRNRVISGSRSVEYDDSGYVKLMPGAYVITFNEVVHLPEDIMALGKPRSSLLRCGVTIHSAVWDAGYHGRSQALLIVYNPSGFQVQRNARVLQLVFLTLSSKTGGYRGIYQGENL